MKKNRRRQNLAIVMRSKAQIAQQTSLTVMHRHTPLFFGNSGNTQAWYQFRKSLDNKVRNISNDKLIIFENGWRTNNENIWLQDLRCEHVFKFRTTDLNASSADRACPFCHGTQDMKRYGNVAAVQEHVKCMTMDTIEFLSDNILAYSKDSYTWQCVFHRGLQIEASFDSF
jgi:hypothetical protein